MQLPLSTLVLCTLGLEGALALPSVHLHHRHARSTPVNVKRVNFEDPSLYKDVKWHEVFAKKAGSDSSANPSPSAGEQGATDVVVPTQPKDTTTQPQAKAHAESPQSKPKATVSDKSQSASGEFCKEGFGSITAPIANGNVDQYIGNVGSPHGSNIIMAEDGKQYKYTNTFVNKSGKDTKVVVWNKSGPDGQPNSGQFSKPCLEFKLPAGGSKTVAFDENSQVAFCPDSGKRTPWGAYDCTYGEADFGNLSNNKWSGYDVSAIQNGAGNTFPMKITCPNGATSSNEGNGYTSDKQPGGLGGNLPPGPVTLQTHIG